MSPGSLMALDVGGGTQDLFIWYPGQSVESAVKMVLPAPTQVMARRLARLTGEGATVFLNGRVMGGGAVTRALRRHLAQGLAVFATPEAALSFDDRLERVQQWGVVLTSDPPPQAVTLSLGDVAVESLHQVLAAFEVPFPTHFAVAVQDHGFNPGGSNRLFRFEFWEKFLRQGGQFQNLSFFEPPTVFTRMQAAAETLPGALLMDTCPAGVRGALLDPAARERQDEGLMVVNLGNAHTFAALVLGERLLGIYEHHTGLLSPEKLFDHLSRFQKGELTNAEIFADQGHGCVYGTDYSRAGPFSFTVITGPRRRLAHGWPGVFAAPFGDMMLTGCFGLVAAFLATQQNFFNLDESL